MAFTLATWNINSVRLRQDLVAKLMTDHAPDVLCLQECKSPVEKIPHDVFADLGYVHMIARGQKGYNGVAILSKMPITETVAFDFADLGHARHIAGRLENGVTVHNFYVPAGGDIPDRDKNEKFGQKLDYLTDMRNEFRTNAPQKAILVGDLNIAPREDDVWNHKSLLKIVSHTPIEVEHLAQVKRLANGLMSRAKTYLRACCTAGGPIAPKTGMRLTRGGVWIIFGRRPISRRQRISSKIVRDARGWDQPSDHAPVFATFDL